MKDALGHGSNPRGEHSGKIDQLGEPKLVHPKVLSHIQKNPGGFSIDPEGRKPRSGFMVSLPGHTLKVNESDLAGPTGSAILERYAQLHSDVLSQRGAHLGGWTDKETGTTHLDISHNIRDRKEAIRAGRARNQIAIWDVKRGKEIRTGGRGD